jgi:hypothetical protein
MPNSTNCPAKALFSLPFLEGFKELHLSTLAAVSRARPMEESDKQSCRPVRAAAVAMRFFCLPNAGPA